MGAAKPPATFFDALDAYNGVNLPEISERLGLTLAEAFDLLALDCQRNRLAKSTWRLVCAGPRYLAVRLGEVLSTDPEMWRSLPTDLQIYVADVLHRAAGFDVGRMHPEHSAENRPIPVDYRSDPLYASVVADPQASPMPAPWRHPVLRRALLCVVSS